MTAAAEISYRTARRAFIAACDTTGVDAIARVHPSLRAVDGRPLFLDSAAIGPRDAQRGLLLVATDAAGSALQIDLLREGIAVPPGARLVLVHALVLQADPGWRTAMLGVIAGEDLARASILKLMTLGATCGVPDVTRRPGTAFAQETVATDDPAHARARIAALLA